MPSEPWLHYLSECESTNTWATQHLSELRHGDWVYTPKQTAGRGQKGRRWYAPPGVITASLVVDRLPLPAGSIVIGLAVIEALVTLLPTLEIQLKWPNDLLIAGRKLAGILCEASRDRVVAGVGLNYSADFRDFTTAQVGKPTSLQHHFAVLPSEREILSEIRDRVLSLVPQLPPAQPLTPLQAQLQRYDALWQQPAAIATAQGVWHGHGAGIASDGCLQIRLADGKQIAIASGQII